jgi:hypothetical protein
MRAIAVLLAITLTGCAAFNPATQPDTTQATAWRYADGSPVTAAAFASMRDDCARQAAAQKQAFVPRSGPPLTEGVAVPSIAGSSVPPPIPPAPAPPRPEKLVELCLTAQGLIPAR